MKTVGYVLRTYPVLYHATVFNEIRALQRMGYRIEVFSLLDVPPVERRRDGIADLPAASYCWTSRQPRAAVLRANLALLARVGPARYRAAYVLARDAALLTNLKSFMRFAAWAEMLRRRGVRHWHAHWATEAATVAWLFSRLTALPFSFTAHAYDLFLQPQYLAEKLAAAAFAVTVSAYNRQYVIDRYGEQLGRTMRVIYPLIDAAQFVPRAGPPDGAAPVIVAVGRLTECKGFIHLVEACRLLRARGVPVRCDIIGEGEERARLEAAIRAGGLGDAVRLRGSLAHEAVPPLLEAATAFAMPCVIAANGDRDGMPMVLLEAMARAVPVVASDVIGLPEVVRDGAGVLVPPDDAAALADALARVVRAGPAEQRVMGQAGRCLVEHDLDARIGAARLAALFEGR